MTRLPFLLLCCSIGVAAQAPAQQTPTGTTMPAAAPPTKQIAPDAPAVLHGRVVAVDTGRALYRALVHLNRTGPASLVIRREALTDSDGRYRFDNIPPGDYMVYASRIGFVEMRAGQKQPAERVYPLDIPAGGIQRIDFALPRGGVISGRLSDETGEPIPGIRLVPLRFAYGPYGERLSSFTPVPFGNLTDDRGEFRVAGLPPGIYMLAADCESESTCEVCATTYYPGTRNLSEARRFRLGLSEQITASFSLQTARRVRISGHVRSSTGAPLESYRAVLRTKTGLNINGGQIKNSSGAFSFEGIPPGSYKLDISRAGMSGVPDLPRSSMVRLGCVRRRRIRTMASLPRMAASRLRARTAVCSLEPRSVAHNSNL